MAELLKIEGLKKGYTRGGWAPVFVDVSLEVVQGEIVAVIGGRFEGKTTLLKIAAGVEHPNSGSVTLEGRAMTDLEDRPREVRWIDRDGPGFEEAEVAEFVGWPLAPLGRERKWSEQAAAQMLEQVGARDCFGLRWGDLSNWQRALVGLARAFIGSPKLVVIDDLLDTLHEPTTQEASDLLRSLVEQSRSRCGVLMSVSDMESAVYADRVLSITGKHSLRALSGRLSDDGTIVPLRGRRSQADCP